MFLTKRSLPRRTFLRGMGAAVALPLLDSMLPAATALAQSAATPVKRAGFIYLPHGFIMDQWTPDTAGVGYDFNSIMKPLEPYRDQMVIASGMDGAPNGGTGGHATGPASFLSDVSPRQTEGNDIRNGVTIDQVIARDIGRDTIFPSLEVATEDFTGFVGACEVGYSCVYLNTLSWSSPTTPLPMEINPRVLFERMFGGSGTLEQRIARRQTNKSILDAVAAQARRLEAGLGSSDRTRVTEYLDNIREIERRIQKAEAQSASQITAPSEPAGIPDDFTEHCSLMYDLLAIALQADMTRVFTFMMARDLHQRVYLDIGVDEGHHVLSHHGGNAERLEKFAKINTYHVSLFGRFLERLSTTQDGDGTLLDHSLIVFGSGMSTGNVHSHVGLPFVVAGDVKGGRHVTHPRETPHGNLLVTVAQRAGARVESFGRSNGTVDL